MSRKFSLVVELKFEDGDNPNKEVCQSTNPVELENAAAKIAQHEDVKRVVPITSSLEGETVTGYLGYTRNTFVVPSDKIEEL